MEKWYIGNPFFSGLGRFLFGAPTKDFHCGLRAFSRDAFLRMDLRTTGMEFASEMVIKATLLEMRIIEVPTTLSRDGRSRPPHLRPYRDGWRHLRFMLLFSPNWLFLYPGLVLMFIGISPRGEAAREPRLHPRCAPKYRYADLFCNYDRSRLSSSALCFIVESLCSARGTLSTAAQARFF